MLPLRRIIIEHSIRPEILDFLSIEEVQELFNIYFDVINPQIPILDRAFHTPALVASRSPFLLTTSEFLFFLFAFLTLNRAEEEEERKGKG